MSAEFLQSQRRADQTSEEPVGEAKELDKGEAMEAGVPEGGGGDTEVGSEHVEFLPVEWYEQVSGDGYGRRGYTIIQRKLSFTSKMV